MFNVSANLGVQSWCFREFKPLDALIAQVKAIGLSRIEVCGVHADFDNESTFAGTINTFKNAGVTITSIGVQGFKGDPKEEKWFAFAKQAGCTMISTTFNVDAYPACVRATEKLADKYDLVMGIHNHGGYDWLGNEQMLTHVLKNSSPRIGMCIDTAWAMQAGIDPIKMTEKYIDRLYGVHIKDFTFLPTGKGEDVVVGTGNLKLKELLALIQKAPKCKAITLEYEGDEKNPGPKLKECVDKIQHAG